MGHCRKIRGKSMDTPPQLQQSNSTYFITKRVGNTTKLWNICVTVIWSSVEEVCRRLEDRNMFANRRNVKDAILGNVIHLWWAYHFQVLVQYKAKYFCKRQHGDSWCRECTVNLTSKCAEKFSFSILETDISFHTSYTSIEHWRVCCSTVPTSSCVRWSFSPFGILEAYFSSLNCRIMTAETKFTSP
jgi:hypothetical protein